MHPLPALHRDRRFCGLLLAAIVVALLAASARTEPAPDGAAVPKPKTDDQAIAEVRRTHWAFQPVHRPALPAVKDLPWAQTAIDRFILAKLEEKRLAPSPPA